MKNIIASLLITFLALISKAQVVTTQPFFPVDGTGSVTIYFHADQGNMALNNFSGDIYVHTGVVITSSTSLAWSNVVTTWGTANTIWKMTSLGNNLYSYTINNLRAFYAVNAGQTIYKIAILFRNGAGSTVARNSDGSDFFIPVIQPNSFEGYFFEPSQGQVVLPPATNTIGATFVCSQNASVSVYQNNVLQVTNASTDSLSLMLIGNPGQNKVKVIANNGNANILDSFIYVISPAVSIAALPAGVKDGVNYNNNGPVTLVLVAPAKNNVYAFGDFSNWEIDTAYFMKNTPDGTRWWITLNGLTANQEYAYQFLVDGNLKVADPYGEKVLDPNNDQYIPATVYPNLKPYPVGKTSGIVSVLQPGKAPYNWTSNAYQKPGKNNLIVYELLLRDFLASHSYHDLIDTISYFKRLGINAIELMPVNEFEGNESWGYNTSFYFTADKYYGPSDSLKKFIDKCHSENIAVIMDMVLNHSFSQSPMCQLYWDNVNSWPSTTNPWYNSDCDPSTAGYQGKHPYGVGFDFNHQSAYTKKFVSDVVHYWVKEYKMDGYRFDLSKGFTQFYSGTDVNLWGQYDQSRINIWKEYADSLWSLDPTTYGILEHFADNSEEKVLANYGLMIWGNLAYAYAQSAMGYATSNGALDWVSYQNRGWANANVVGYMESHDEERTMYKCLQNGSTLNGYNIKDLNTSLERIKLNSAFFFTIPGPKMIWEFEELGYDYSITYNGNLSPKPVRWDYYSNTGTYYNRYSLYNTFKSLIKLKTQYPATFNSSSFSLSTGSYTMRSIYLNNTNMNATVLGNFGTITGTINANFQHVGWWYDYFSGDSLNVTSLPHNLELVHSEYRVYTDKKLAAPDLSIPVGIKEIADKKKENSAYLLQNYPNPFKDKCVIQFGTAKEMHIKIELYDITGKKMDTVTNKKYNAGDYTFELDGQKLENGIYTVLLTSESGYTESIKVVLSKN